MDKATTPFDFATGEAKAKDMSPVEIHGALIDIRKTLPGSDALDRALGGDRGGYYRDEASVLIMELTRRNLKRTLTN